MFKPHIFLDKGWWRVRPIPRKWCRLTVEERNNLRMAHSWKDRANNVRFEGRKRVNAT